MVRVAAFDCGTHSLRLLIADVDPVTGVAVEITRRMEVVRLGAGVDQTGRLGIDAIDRAAKVAAEYAAQCEAAGVTRSRFVATSATRDAANRDVFVDRMTTVVGVRPEVITGQEEAELSFRGATTRLRCQGMSGPFLVVDIGGGSTEVVIGDAVVTAAQSVDIGCVRLTERHLRDDPPRAAHLAAARSDINQALDDVAKVVDFRAVRHLVGLAGSVATVAALGLGLSSYDEERLHGVAMPVPVVLGACDRLVQMTHAERAALPFMHPGRVDVIGGGALIWQLVVERVARQAAIADVRASRDDILDGIAMSIAATVSGGA
ncbi:MAG: exopolyphosphatase [Actinomycetota bacterium]